jgi:hypothetical protein
MLDPNSVAVLSFAVASAAGYISGYGTVRINYFLVILLGKAWSSGHARKRYIPIGAYATIVYFILAAHLLYPEYGYIAKAITVPVFVGLYALGVLHSERRYKDSLAIMDKLIGAMYYMPDQKPSQQPPSDDESKQAIDDACRIARDILAAMPTSNVEILKVLFLTFDSRTAVFFTSLGSGTLKFRRFTGLKRAEQIEYIRQWSENNYLFYAIQGIKSLMSFSYYSSHHSWAISGIPYDGNFLRRSYLK